MAKYITPKYVEEAFNCPRCGVLVPHKWYSINSLNDQNEKPTISELNLQSERFRGFINNNERYRLDWKLDLSICTYCKEYTIWENRNIIYPLESNLPKPHDDMFEDVKNIYEEALLVYKHSPRASAALLRLAIETMIPQLEEYKIKKSNLNTMIGELVKKDIPLYVQQGLDSIRIYGNEGIHPGEINLNEEQETVLFLFELINIMIEELITRRKKINSFYSKLPKGKTEAVTIRDNPK